MRTILKRFTGSTLVRGSLLVFIASNAANFGNFLYNILMGRFLGPEKYSELGALLSVLVLTGVPLSILSLLIVKMVSSYWGKKDIRRIYSLYKVLTPKLFFVGLVAGIIMVVLIPWLSGFLHLPDYTPLIIITLYMTISFPSALNRSILNGSLYFSLLTVNSLIEIVTKVILSVILVINNFGVAGALLGLLLASMGRYLLATWEFKFIIWKEKYSIRKTETGLMVETFWPVLLVTLMMTSFFTIDIILIRHFFTPLEAGEYVALSTIGRIIYYAVGPVISVMFPLISSRISNGTAYILPLLGTLLMSLLISTGLMFLFFLFPANIMTLLFGGKYALVSSYLGLFSFFISIYSLNSILTHFLLSISYYKPILWLFLISFTQIIGIFLFHSSIGMVIWVNILTSLFYLAIVSIFVIHKEYRMVTLIYKKIKKQEYSL